MGKNFKVRQGTQYRDIGTVTLEGYLRAAEGIPENEEDPFRFDPIEKVVITRHHNEFGI